jgi:hypothetical protein
MLFVSAANKGVTGAWSVSAGNKDLFGQFWGNVREKLGAILDKNESAILAMQSATKLPDCDWGLDYRAGPQASIAYAPRARVLARLNTPYGMRMAAKGQTLSAVDSWLAGIRFSQDVTKGGTLIFALIAKAMLLPNLRALAHEVQSGSLNVSQRKQAESAIRALPETAFDWGEAMRLEEANLYLFLDRMKGARDPSAYYVAVMGEAAHKDFSLPNRIRARGVPQSDDARAEIARSLTSLRNILARN